MRTGAQSAVQMGGSGSSSFFTQVLPADLILRPPSRLFSAKIPRNLFNQVHFLRSQTVSPFSTSTTVSTSLTAIFSIAQLPISAEVASLFDQYAIAEVVWTVTATGPQTSGASVSALPIVSAVDFDGQSFLSPPTTIAQVQQFSTSLTSWLAVGQSVSRVIKPCVESTLFTGGSGGFATERLWIDSGNQNVPHYGVLSVAPTTAAGSIDGSITISMVIAARNNN